jgi:hypothetical protein
MQSQLLLVGVSCYPNVLLVLGGVLLLLLLLLLS